MKVVLPLVLLSLLTAQSAIAGEGSRSAAGLDHKTEIALADTHNWVSATQNIASDADQQNLDHSQTLNPLVTVAGAKVFSPANISNGAPRGAAKTPAPAPIYNLINHNGPILANTHLYAVWWGPTANFPAGYQSGILAALAGTACTTSTCSGMSALMNQYFPNGTRSAITYSGQYSDTSAPVTSAPTTAAIVTEVNKVVTNANLDPNGLYLVFTSNFPTKAAYCGWHGAGAVSNKWFTVSYLPNLTGQAGCAASYLPTYTSTPSRSLAVDSVVNVYTHELYETMTDPMLNNLYGWYDALGNEIGDKCAWTTATKVTLGSAGTFTVQQEWSNTAKACSAI